MKENQQVKNYNNDTLSFKYIFRSRSVTPSSHPGTPPQHQQTDLLAASNFSTSLANSLSSGQMKPEFVTARTYSDQLRNFAAKYNSLNEYVDYLSFVCFCVDALLISF